MAITSHPNGKRLDIFFVGTDKKVYQYVAPDGDLRKVTINGIGGEAKAVSASWTKQSWGDQCCVVIQGTNNRPYFKVYGQSGWSDWTVMDGTIFDPCS